MSEDEPKQLELETVPLSLELPGPLYEHLDALWRTGLWGPTREDTGERLIAWAIRQLGGAVGH